MTTDSLAGSKLLVVGGGSTDTDDPDAPPGNGRAISVLAARHGASVAVADLRLEAAQITCDMILGSGGHAVPIQADVTDPDQCNDMVERAVHVLGGLNCIVLNVGFGRGRDLAGTSMGDWDAAFALNVRSNFATLKSAYAVLTDAASIVLISSIAALRPGSRVVAYDASKAAQIALARHAALEGAPRGIRVNVVTPGAIDTPISRNAGRHRPSRSAPVPLGREGSAWDVAEMVVFLLSDRAAWLTGEVIAVDGGASTLSISRP